MLASLSVADEPEGHTESGGSEKAIVGGVCEGPDLTQDGRGKLGLGKERYGGVTLYDS